MRHAARRTLPEEMPEQKRRDLPGAIASEVDATDPECFFPPSNAGIKPRREAASA